MSNRQEIPFKTLWAENAETTIPATPVIGDSYRDEATTDVTVGDGWAYGDPVPSKSENQYNYIQSLIARQLSEQGILSYSDKEDYSASVGAIVMDDGLPYLCLQDNGPTSTVKQPSTEPLYWFQFGITQVKTTVVTSSQTYTPTPGTSSIKVTLLGGGGSGGGVDGQGVATAAVSGSGGSSGQVSMVITELESSYSIVIGAGGSSASPGNNDGIDGGDSTFVGDDTATVSLASTGGGGGGGALASTGNPTALGGTAGMGSGGDINGSGSPGGVGKVISGSVATYPISGSSYFGGGKSLGIGSNGEGATVYGEGGGSCSVSGTATNYAGGEGFQGVCIIEEFF